MSAFSPLTALYGSKNIKQLKSPPVIPWWQRHTPLRLPRHTNCGPWEAGWEALHTPVCVPAISCSDTMKLNLILCLIHIDNKQ